MATAQVSPLSRTAPRSVTILGSTGSVGCNTIDLIERSPKDFKVEVLTACKAVDRLAEQAVKVGARLAVVADESCYAALKAKLGGTGIEVAAGEAALVEAAERQSDWVMAAIVGAAGLRPTLAAIRRGAIVALANKETLVCAGALMCNEVVRHGSRLLPVDSEHNAIFQVLDAERPEGIDRIILTASGGPFRERSLEEMRDATPEQAVKHPNWAMGAKISVDSATMMNKGLELIEAQHLFGLTKDQIEVLVHPQSVIHSMVSYVDGSVLAQLGQPDMRTPIAHTLAWPARMTVPVARLNLAEIGKLTFEEPDARRFPALRVAREVLQAGESAPTIMNAANEVAVAAFLRSELGFLDIIPLVESTLAALPEVELTSLEAVYQIDAGARAKAEELMRQRTRQ